MDLEIKLQREFYSSDFPSGKSGYQQFLISKIAELKADNAALIDAFQHWHVNDEVSDACGKCGLDLRNPVHARREQNG